MACPVLQSPGTGPACLPCLPCLTCLPMCSGPWSSFQVLLGPGDYPPGPPGPAHQTWPVSRGSSSLGREGGGPGAGTAPGTTSHSWRGREARQGREREDSPGRGRAGKAGIGREGKEGLPLLDTGALLLLLLLLICSSPCQTHEPWGEQCSAAAGAETGALHLPAGEGGSLLQVTWTSR